MRPSSRTPGFLALVIVAAIFAWFAATAWLRHFTAPDEGRYASVALGMLTSGDWWVPRLDGLPFFHKPPLFYWLGAAAMSTFGVSEWSARLPSVIGATLAASALFFFTRRWLDTQRAVVVTVVLATLPFFYIGAQFANLDMLVAGLISAAILAAAHATLSMERGDRWRGALAATFAAAALGVLAKGLIGFVLPGAVFCLWAIVSGRTRAAFKLLLWWPGWCLFLAIAAPWFIGMQLRYAGFYDYFVVTQHFRRFAAAGFNNAHPFWFYGPVIAGLSLPWIGWLAATWRSRAESTQRRFSEVDWLMLSWFVVIVVFFSIPRSKLIGYVLPALPPLAWFIARALTLAMASARRPQAAFRWSAGIAAVVCLAAVVAADRYGTPPGARLRLPAGTIVAPEDQVLMLDVYYYEIPFYWRLKQPVLVLSGWHDPALASHDNWRNELLDAGRFEPERAARTLIDIDKVDPVFCAPRRTWVIGSPAAVMAAPWLNDKRFVRTAQNPDVAVWRFDGASCTDGRFHADAAAVPALPGNPA